MRETCNNAVWGDGGGEGVARISPGTEVRSTRRLGRRIALIRRLLRWSKPRPSLLLYGRGGGVQEGVNEGGGGSGTLPERGRCALARTLSFQFANPGVCPLVLLQLGHLHKQTFEHTPPPPSGGGGGGVVRKINGH